MSYLLRTSENLIYKKIIILIAYCEIIFLHWLLYFMYFVGMAIHEFKIPMKYFYSIKSFFCI